MTDRLARLLTDQAQAARLIANEIQQIRIELNAALGRQ